MKKLILVFSFLFTLTMWAKASTADSLMCTVKMSTEIVSEDEVIAPLGIAKSFGELDPYRFKITKLGDAQFEVEVFDPSLPARSYSQGILRQAGDEVKWAFWSSDVLLDVACRLKK